MFSAPVRALFALLAIPFAITQVAADASAQCSNPIERAEWRNMTTAQQTSYIQAVLCLQMTPSNQTVSGALTRFDDFQGAHIAMTDYVHWVGQFLPWHRYFIHTYDSAMRAECHYTGPQPYWDWSIDIEKYGGITDSPIFDATNGFGGSGQNSNWNGFFGNLTMMPGFRFPSSGQIKGGCVNNGPFASYMLHLGPGTQKTTHCLTRAFNDEYQDKMSYAEIAKLDNLTTFEAFRQELEGEPYLSDPVGCHSAGHFAVGGEMNNVYSSPGDPLFYLHHANLDRIWWQWQQANLTSRLVDVSGRSTTNASSPNITLAYPLNLLNLAPIVEIEDVMDIRTTEMCYTYV